MSETEGEYSEPHLVGHPIVWGEGYMSPGGDDEVSSIVNGVEIDGCDILDIGCGLGGPAVALVANHGARNVIGVDIQVEQIENSRALAERRGVTDCTEFRLVDPGPLPFRDGIFDVVFSMGALVQIPEKKLLYREIFRVLRPGGAFAANDWISEWDGPPSEEMAEHYEKTGLTFNWTTLKEIEKNLMDTGFVNVGLTDRSQWLLEHFRADIARLEGGPVRKRLIQAFDTEAADSWLRGWRRLEIMASRGEIGGVQIRAKRPG